MGRGAVNDGIFTTMLDQQVTFLIMYCLCVSNRNLPSHFHFLPHQGDSGESGEPGLQGEVGPPVSDLF